MNTYRVGEVNKNTKGEMMSICKYEDCRHVYVVFEDNNVVGPRTYRAFKNGSIRNVKANMPSCNEKWVLGKTMQLTKNMSAKCIEYRNDNDILVQLSNGCLVDHVNVDDFIDGNISSTVLNDEFLADKAKLDRENTIAMERVRTFNNVLELLYRYHKCMMIRPCSFGKTTIAKKLFRRYEKCLYLYPYADAEGLLSIEEAAKRDKNNKNKMGKLTTMTYSKIAKMNPESIAKLDCDIAFLDEAQFLGAGKGMEEGDHTYNAIKTLMLTHPNTHFVGATATPNRMDGVNVTRDLFNNITTYPYSDQDAFEDGLFTMPKYLYCTYGVKELIKSKAKEAKKQGIVVTKDQLEEILGDEELERVDARYMDKAIKTACEESGVDTSYMRFVCFYRTVKELCENDKKVIGWFQKAFPNHRIRATRIYSRSEKDISAIRKLPVEENTIDLIFNCEMLNLGYHEEHLTGLILDRKTLSYNKYWQMIGRVMSMDSDKQAIVFDIADNIHSEFVYGKESSFDSEEDMSFEEIRNKGYEECEIDESEKNEPITYSKIRKTNRKATNWAKIEENSYAVAKAIEKSEEKDVQTVVDEKKDDDISFHISESKMQVAEESTPSNKELSSFAKSESQELLLKEFNQETGPAISFNKMNLELEGMNSIPIFKSYTAEPQKATKSVATKKREDMSKSFDVTDLKIVDDFGYDPKNYIRTDSGRVISNYVDIINNEVNYDELFAKVVYKPIEERCKKASELFDRLASGFTFSNYEQVSDPENKEYVEILEGAAWTEHITGDTLLYYMITGKVA